MRSNYLRVLPAALASAALFSGCVTRPASGPTPVTSEVIPTPAESASASPWQKIKASFTSSSKQIVAAATPKEHVIKAKDPIALNAPQKKAGADLFVAAARIHETKGDYAAAAGQYERGLAVDGNDLASLIGYAHLLDRRQKYTEATLYYERATNAHPDSAAAWNDLGLCYSRRSKTDRAMRDKSLAALRRAVELNPAKKLYRNNIAAVLVEAGNDGEALTHLMAAHDPATAHYNLGYLSNQQGRIDAARRHFAEALRLNPQMHAARSFLDQLSQQGAAVAEHRIPQQYAPRSLHVPNQETRTGLAPSSRQEPRVMPRLNHGAKAAVKARVAESQPVVEENFVKPAAIELPFGDVELETSVATTAVYEVPVDAEEAEEVEPAVFEDAPGPDDTFGDAPLPE